MQAGQETVVFDRIEVREVATKNDEGNTVTIIAAGPHGMGEQFYSEEGEAGIIIGVIEDVGIVWIFNKEITIRTILGTVAEGGAVSTFDNYEVTGTAMGTNTEGGFIKIFNKFDSYSVSIGQTSDGHGGIWVYDRYGKNLAYYGNREVEMKTIEPCPGEWVTLGEWSGEGIMNTELFRTENREWKINWEKYDEAFKGAGILQVFVKDADGNLIDLAANVTGPSEGSSYVRTSPDEYYLKINSANIKWDIDVTEKRL